MQSDAYFDFNELYIITASFGLPGNIFTICVLLSSAQIRSKPVNIFIIHQSIIDTCVCVVTILTHHFHSMDLIPTSSGRWFICTMWLTKSIMWSCMQCSGYNLMFLTLERYWAITNPLKYDADKVRKRIPFVFIACWIIAFLTIAPNSAFNRIVNGQCRAFYVITESWMLKVLSAYFLLVACVVPGGVMIGAYAAIGLSLKRSEAFQRSDTAASSKKLKQIQMNLLQTCVILVVMFVLCWLNHVIRFVLLTGSYFLHLRTTYYPSTLFFIILNSCLNPFVYCVRYKEFQDRVAVLFRLKVIEPVSTSADTGVTKYWNIR